MNIRVTEHDDFLTLSLNGRLDIMTASKLKEEILQRLDSGTRSIILNMAQVDFINSSGLGTLIWILKDVRAVGGRLVLSNLASYVEEIFENTQLSGIFEIFAAEAEAQEALRTTAKTGANA